MIHQFLLLIICMTVFSPKCFSQDANYWTSNYGPGGFFTPGAVVAHNRDSGVFFYNPALLGLSEKNSTSVSANIYQFSRIRFKDGVGTGKNLVSSATGIVPLMAAGTISIKGKQSFTLGYALIANPVLSFNANQRLDARIDALDDSYSPGKEFFVGQYALENTISQTTGIISFGKKMSDFFSVGGMLQADIRKQNYQVSYNARALVNVSSDTIFPPLVSMVVNYAANYYYVGASMKVGLAYNRDRHHAGLMISSPSLRLAGTGIIASDIVIGNIRDMSSGTVINLLANARQDKLKARFKMPLSVAAGYALDIGKGGQLYLASEYFTRQQPYNILLPRNDYFVRPDTGGVDKGSTEQLRLKDARKALANFALGLSFYLKPQVMGFAAVRTDFSYADQNAYNNEEGYTPNITTWNIYHLQAGINVKKRKFNLRAGLLVSYGGTGNQLQNVNFNNPNESNFLLGTPQKVRVSYLSAGLMFSYIYNL